MIILVTYDLKTPGRNYTPFYEALKAQGHWWHYLANTWLIDTASAPQKVYEALGPHLSTSDRILVIQVSRLYQGYLPKAAWDWINSRHF
jgi:hypothetical protein